MRKAKNFYEQRGKKSSARAGEAMKGNTVILPYTRYTTKCDSIFFHRLGRWFTRGWTLQELIAPSSVEFFARNGRRLGDRESLEQIIHEITGITITVLGGAPLSSFSIDERMSWARNRKTKKPEDKAYSLLGIFHVHMPLIYGEGEEKAINRLRIEIGHQSGIIRDMSDRKFVLDYLPIAEDAAFSSHAEEHSPTCLPGTRVGLLQEIMKWADSPNSKALFWLNGMAGTGKSTISRTLAHSFTERDQLGASFFLKRGESARGGVSRLFTTITAQLIQRDPALARHVRNAIDNDPAIPNKTLQEQFNKLILMPLSKASPYRGSGGATVIIIDALDECDKAEDIKLVIQLLSNANTVKPAILRIILTSRPELPVRIGFARVPGAYQGLSLHEIDERIVKRDLAVYFEYELGKIKAEYNISVPNHRRLSSSWYTYSQIQTLAEMTTPLFISASTACRFIAERKTGAPDMKLQRVLENNIPSRKSKPDSTYLLILEQLLADMSTIEKEEALDLFRRLVGSIVLLEEPLPTSALANLLDIPEGAIEVQLDFLHSVLHIPSSSTLPVRLLHSSFRDFLVDPSNRGKHCFWVDKDAAHSHLSEHCLRVMDKTLPPDIFKWNGPEAVVSQMVNDSLALEVQYACMYWVHHFRSSRISVVDD
ncbi:hypothetical protein NPX13_g691 [Xylaria arbuscula]|uniref:Nephrocystin 3-like N-terminal domain-containing protein n=1 Tax=Xylaria arbuscula TaxID=114810 RepID=A0A9W8NN11_9PEZI|nr:hypothetical protein NPX13_g691 [Xylaria arbuscula]